MTIGQQLKDAGCDRVYENTSEAWKEAFFAQADDLLFRNGSYTSEEVVALIGRPHHPNAIGAATRVFSKDRNLIPTYEPAKQPAAHARIITRWHSQ